MVDKDFFAKIGKNVTEMILERAQVKAVLVMRASSKMLKRITDQNRLWIKLVKRDFRFDVATHEDAMQIYKDEYIVLQRYNPIWLAMKIFSDYDCFEIMKEIRHCPSIVPWAILRGWDPSKALWLYWHDNYIEIVKSILKYDDINPKMINSALHFVIEDNCINVAKLLLAKSKGMDLPVFQNDHGSFLEGDNRAELLRVFLEDGRLKK